MWEQILLYQALADNLFKLTKARKLEMKEIPFNIINNNTFR